ncbi:unnamed protein product [Calypogeia fissa]
MGLNDDDDNVVYGTRLVDEDELGRSKGKLATQKGQVRQVAPWKQEVTDSEGRRRFHGAFTGGFSAGYWNTVGSKEGWTPSTFSSSRNKRAGKKEQTVYEFLDEDEKEELKVKELVLSAEYDALGSSAAELARRNSSNEINLWSSVVPGLVPDEIVAESQSIGIKLLMKMGWRQGYSVGEERITFPSVASDWRGLGVVEALKSDFGNKLESNTVQDVENVGSVITSTVSKRSRSDVLSKNGDCLPSFTPATKSSLSIQPLRLPSPVIPADFTMTHILPPPLAVIQYLSRQEPPDVPSPDPKAAKAINGVAAFVARSGQKFEDILKEKHFNNPQFAFLFDGRLGHEFYVRKLWEEQRNLSNQGKKQSLSRSDSIRSESVRANSGNILGERPLPQTEIPVASTIKSKEDSSSFIRSEALSELTAQMNTRFTTGASDLLPKRTDGLAQVEVIKPSSDFNRSSDIINLHRITRRAETQWRPTSLLCKRFNLPELHFGKDPSVPKSGPKVDPVTILANLSGIVKEPSLHLTQSSTSVANALTNENTRDTIISEDSIDLYKAIFSDDEDEDADQRGKPFQNPKDAAGDFLESLGKELGLRV